MYGLGRLLCVVTRFVLNTDTFTMHQVYDIDEFYSFLLICGHVFLRRSSTEKILSRYKKIFSLL